LIPYRKTQKVLLATSREVGLEVNPEKTKYMLIVKVSEGRSEAEHNDRNKCFESMVKFIYLGTTLTDQNYIHEEIKNRLNSGNTCYHSVQSLFSSRLLSKNVNVKIYKTLIHPQISLGKSSQGE
jgi:hypothetical protein